MRRLPVFACLSLVASFLLTTSLANAAPAPTTTTLTSSANPVVIGQELTYMVKVVSSNGAPLTGPLRISFNGTTNQDLTLQNGGYSITQTVTGAPRTIQVIATYAGDANTAPSTSATLNEVVVAAAGLNPTSVSVATSANPAYTNQALTYTATVVGAAPTGSVTFFPGTTTLPTEPR